MLKVVRIKSTAKIPTRGTKQSCGLDLYSAESCILPQRGKMLVSTGIKIEIPTLHFGRIAPRSSLALNHFIDVGAGIIDEDYRGELKVLLFNHGNEDYQINVGDRIAQLIIQNYVYLEPTLVESLETSSRGEGGFGSTGK